MDGEDRGFHLSQRLETQPCPCPSPPPCSALHPRGRQGRDSSADATRCSRGHWSWQHGACVPSLPCAACPTAGLLQGHLRWAGLPLASPKRLLRPLILGSSIKISGPVLKGGKSAGFPGVSEAAGFMPSEVLSLSSQRFPGEDAALQGDPRYPALVVGVFKGCGMGTEVVL